MPSLYVVILLRSVSIVIPILACELWQNPLSIKIRKVGSSSGKSYFTTLLNYFGVSQTHNESPMSLVQFAKFHGGTSAFAFYKSGRISRQKIVNFFLERIMMISLTLLLLKSNNS